MDSGLSWDPEESQIPKEALQKLLTSLLVAEEHQWLESGSPIQRNSSQTSCCSSCSNSSVPGDGISSCGRCDPGFKLLRHGNSISQIHSYFQSLEPRRYCLSLTARNKIIDRPCNRMRVVRGDSRLDQNPPREEGVANTRHGEAILSDKESELYEKVFLCCQIPVLSAPPVPSPYSPSPSPGSASPTVPRTARFGSSGQISTHFQYDDSSYSPPPKGHVFSPFYPSFRRFSFRVDEVSLEPVQPEQLQELVRKTFFGLSKRECLWQEKIIREKMYPKTADRVLVEDLLTQLSLLNKNFHPYYRIQSFLDKNGYDEWVEAEKVHINRLVKRFWNSPLPSLNECYPIHVFDAHEGYKMLLSKLIREESTNKTSHSVFGDVTPTCPLSPASCRLLREFGLRYGVGELYRHLTYLRYLVDHFECEVWFIKHVTDLLEIVMGLVTNTPEIYVKEEFLMFIYILSLLLRLSKYYLTRVTRLFKQNSPPGGVASLVAMANLIQEAADFVKSTFVGICMNVREAREFLESLDEEPFENILASYLKEEIEGRYERFKVIAIDELGVNRYENPLSPQLLNILILNIRDEITSYKTYYQEEFHRFLDFVQLATVTYYQLLMDDVNKMCQHIPRNIPADEVDVRMLSLAFRLSVFDKDNAKYLNLGMQTWREPFRHLSLIWMDVVGRHLEGLVPVLLQKDPWQVTMITREESVSKPTSTAKPTPRIQLITQSDRSAFTPVRCSSESDIRERSKQQQHKHMQALAASNPNLSAIVVKKSPELSISRTTEVAPTQQPVHVVVSTADNSDFKGKVIVTQAQIHVPEVENNEFSSSDDSNKTEFIGDMTFHRDKDILESMEGTMNIEDIDRHHKNMPSNIIYRVDQENQENQENQAESSVKLNDEIPGIDVPGPAGKIDRNPDFMSQTEQELGCKTLEVVETERSPSPTGSPDNYRATPYENDDIEATSPGSTDTSGDSYTKAKSSLSEDLRRGTQDEVPISEGTSTQVSLSDESTLTQFTTNTLDQSVKGAQTQNSADTIVRTVGSTLAVQDTTRSQQTLEEAPTQSTLDGTAQNNDLASHESISGNSPNKTTQQDEEWSQLKCKTSSLDCPQKAVSMPIDHNAADLPAVDMTTKNTDTRFEKPSALRVSASQSLDVPANKHLSRTLAAENTSLSSVPTVYGSCPSSSAAASYFTARDTSSSSGDNIISDYESNASTSYESLSDSRLNTSAPPTSNTASTKTELVPVSSSLVDLLCCIQRLTSFACHLCKVLCPNERVIPGNDGQIEREEIKNKIMEIKTALCGKLIRIVKRIMTLFVDDILAIETCGMSEDDMVSVVGQNITRHLIGRYRSGEVIGCRLNPGRRQRCNMTNSAGKKTKQCEAMCKVKDGPSGCEVTAAKMGLRSSDVTVLKSLLSWLHDRIVTAIIRLDTVMGFDGTSGEFDRLSILSESYCQNGPTLEGSSRGIQQDTRRYDEDEYLRLAQSLDVSLDECSADLEGNLRAQDKLMAYRMNELFKKILHQLLSLSLPSFSVRKRLQPAIDFLRRRLSSMRRVMFPDSFMVVIKCLWRHIAQDFNEEVEQLKERRPGASQHAELLLMSLAHFMQFFHNQNEGLAFDELSATTEPVTKHIELYTSSTVRLIGLYRWLHQQMLSLQQEQVADEFTSSVSTLSHNSRGHSPADYLIEAMCSELHATSKCFSGSVFVEWVRKYVQKNGYDSLGVCIGTSDTDTGVELGQYLLERDLLVCVGDAEPTQFAHPDQVDEEEADNILVQQRASHPSRGAVVVTNVQLPSQMRINEISVKKHSSSGSHPNSSQSSSHYSTDLSDLSDSSEELDTQGLLDSVDMILQGARSNQSLALIFHNSPNVFYSFISDENGSGGELKYKLAFIDRFSVGIKLQHIVCALYTRKDDETARFFLKRLAINEVAYALGYKKTPFCFNI